MSKLFMMDSLQGLYKLPLQELADIGFYKSLIVPERAFLRERTYSQA